MTTEVTPQSFQAGGKALQSLLTHCGSGLRVQGMREKRQGRWATLGLSSDPIFDSVKTFSRPPRDVRAPFSLWWTLYHYLPSLPHFDQSHSLPQLPGENEREVLIFGAYVHTDQGLGTNAVAQRQAKEWEEGRPESCALWNSNSLSWQTGRRASNGTLRRLGVGGLEGARVLWSYWHYRPIYAKIHIA